MHTGLQYAIFFPLLASPSPLSVIIVLRTEKDVPRTDRKCSFYRDDSDRNLTRLYDILLTYSVYNMDFGTSRSMIVFFWNCHFFLCVCINRHNPRRFLSHSPNRWSKRNVPTYVLRLARYGICRLEAECVTFLGGLVIHCEYTCIISFVLPK